MLPSVTQLLGSGYRLCPFPINLANISGVSTICQSVTKGPVETSRLDVHK